MGNEMVSTNGNEAWISLVVFWVGDLPFAPGCSGKVFGTLDVTSPPVPLDLSLALCSVLDFFSRVCCQLLRDGDQGYEGDRQETEL